MHVSTARGAEMLIGFLDIIGLKAYCNRTDGRLLLQNCFLPPPQRYFSEVVSIGMECMKKVA